MGLKNLHNTEYADALREAIILWKDNAIDPATDSMLGNCLHSIAMWCIADWVRAGKLWPVIGADPDFQAHVVLEITMGMTKVNTELPGRAILKYLYNVGSTNGVHHYIRNINRKKRKGDLVSITDASITTDFYGNRTQAREILIQTQAS
jgi:hypothetical protein